MGFASDSVLWGGNELKGGSVIKRILIALVVAIGLALPTVSANAAPVLDSGWSSDLIYAANTPSDGSPYNFSLGTNAWFRITDAFVPGDIFQVFDGIHLILTTTFQAFPSGFGDNTTADSAWTSATWSSGQVMLAPGLHSLTVQGDGAGGVPAGFYTRLDSAPVPEPGTLALFGLGLAGLGFARRRRVRAT